MDPEPVPAAELEQWSKKQYIEWLQHHGNNDFLKDHHLKGQVKNVAKSAKPAQLHAAYKDLWQTKQFRSHDDDEALAKEMAEKAKIAEEKKIVDAKAKEEKEKAAALAAASKKEVVKEKKLYTHRVLIKGDKMNYPSRGNLVKVRYTGTLDDGTVFDSNEVKPGAPILSFKVGTGQVIRGWDEALMEMSIGEKARIHIQSEWAYGKKGMPPKIPPNADLTFEVTLEDIKV